MGPTDVHGHLITCHGSIEVVEELCHQAQRRMLLGQANAVNSFLKSTKATPRQKAMHDWINATVDKSWPVSCMEDATVRHFLKHAEIPLLSKHSKEVMHCLVKSVEKTVGDEMKKASIRAIVHDGWSKVSTHCFGLCACHSL